MIAVQTNDSIYIIKMEMGEFMTAVAKDGLNSPIIRAKTQCNIHTNEALIGITPFLSDIKCQFQLVGENNWMFNLPQSSDGFTSDEFKFYISLDGEQYSCKNAYLLDLAKKSKEEESAAGQLDGILRSLPSITSLAPALLSGVKNYIAEQKESFHDYAEQYLRERCFFTEDREELKTEFDVPNAIGASNDMLDSLLVFPVYSKILAKKNLEKSFSVSDLKGSTFVRICPLGINGDKVQGCVQEIKITTLDVDQVERIVDEKLKKKNISKRKLKSAEKYALYEETLEEFYKKRDGNLQAAIDTKMTLDLNRKLDDLSAKCYIPSMDEWNSYDVNVYDAREKTNELPVTLLEQLTKIAPLEKPMEAMPMEAEQSVESNKNSEIAVASPEEEKPVEEVVEPEPIPTFDEPEIRSITIKKGDSSRRILPTIGDTIQISEMYLEPEMKDHIVESKKGYVLNGYIYDAADGRIKTNLDYQIAFNRAKVEPVVETQVVESKVEPVVETQAVEQKVVESSEEQTSEDDIEEENFPEFEGEVETNTHKPIFHLPGQFSFKNITFDGKKVEPFRKVSTIIDVEPSELRPVETPQESLVDYVKPDGTYVSPDGEEYASREQYQIFKMLTDDSYLQGEEEKGKRL